VRSPADDSGCWFEARELYARYRKDRARLLCLGRLEIHRASFVSRHCECLLPEDRAIAENLRFEFPVFQVAGSPAGGDLLVILHGLNETLYNKLFPWAASLARRFPGPVALFPMALHLSRRPHAWIEEGRDLFPARAALPGNSRVSPFNSVFSQRLNDRPGRLLRGGLQSCRDLADLALAWREGTLAPFGAGGRLQLLGYSAGGYVALTLLLADPGGQFGESRLALLASGAAAPHGVHPESLLIMDRLAAEAVHEYYVEEGYRSGGDAEVAEWIEAIPEGRWLREIYCGGAALAAALAPLRGRVVAFAGARDEVVTAAAMASNLRGIPVHRLELGVHELPFWREGSLPEVYNASVGRRLLVEVGRAADVGPGFRVAFTQFVEGVSRHLAGGGGGS
jgi:surfactin synthase thioesterase subunit